MRVRYATAQDTPRLLELARQEHAISPWRDEPFDEAAAADTIEQFLVSMGRTVLCSDGGYIAGLVQPAGFSRQLLAMEYAWFANDGSGMALLAEFERWGKAMGASHVVVNSMGTNRRLELLLQIRRKYGEVCSTFARPLEDA